MSINSSQRPGREWLWFIVAIVAVGGITVPLWQYVNPPESKADYWSKWTPERIGRLLLGPEQIACYFCFAWAWLMLTSRYREVRRQRGAFALGLLPTDSGVRILPEDARPMTRKIEAITGKRPYILARMIQLALGKYAVSGKAPDVGEVVRSQADIEQNRMVTSMSMINYLSWAIPAIGFLGTVRGLAGGMSKAGNQRDADFIKQVTDQLGIAFDCTFVALSISVVLMYFVHIVQRAEEMLIIDCQGHLQEHLLLRLYEPQTDTSEENRPYRV